MADDDQLGAGPGEPGDFGTPRPQRSARARKAVKRSSTPTVTVEVSVAESIAMLYGLGGNFAAQRGLPATAGMMTGRSRDFGVAWDKFLRRWPALYEMIEKGTIASDVIALLMLHVELFQTMNREIDARNAYLAAHPEAGGESAAA